jgi:transcriptional regulator of nitric oxide reductase
MVLLLMTVGAVLAGSAGLAADFEYLTNTPPLIERVTPEVLAAVFPGAQRIEILDDGGPPAASVYRDDEVVGYVFSTLDVVRAPGYSGTPFDAVAGVDLAGKVTGAVALFHQEPHIESEPHRTRLLVDFLQALNGMEARVGASDGPRPEFIAGATISARAMRNAVRESANLVLSFRNGTAAVTEPTIDTATFRQMTPDELIADGSVSQLTVTNADLAQALEMAGFAGREVEVAPTGGPDAVYLDLRVGLATPPTIGRNGAGADAYAQIFSSFPAGSSAIIFGSNGPYDFQGSKFQNKGSDYRLERIRVVQGDHVFEFEKTHYLRPSVARGTPTLGRVTGIVVLPPDSGFDPMLPWSAEVYVSVKNPVGLSQQAYLATIDYELPTQYILLPQPPPPPAWVEAWTEGKVEIIILGAALAVLTLIFAFQSKLARSRRAHRWVRNGFLVFTLVWIGWIAGGQLSIIHIINYVKAPFQNLDLGFYLAEPLIVMITIYAGISLLMIGRGVFCGWLCPFGALQELLAQIARAFRLPQWNPPDRLQKYLWMGKYISLAAVLVLTFAVPSAGAAAEEVEPFKTVITSMFARSLPYVVYATSVLTVGLFTERAFCRFLCPLGGALAVLDRLHLLNLLKRRPECGSPCRLCERSCPVRAIVPSGKIKTAECFQCLDCQVEYYDDRRCPPLVQMRKQHERAARGPQTVFTRNGLPGGRGATS